MEHLVGIAGKDFVVIAADKSVNVSVARIHHDDDKILNLDNHRMFAAVGPKVRKCILNYEPLCTFRDFSLCCYDPY